MDNREKSFVSAVVYVNNCAGRIEPFLTNVLALLGGHFEHSELICVNDFSSDDSAERIKALLKRVDTGATSVSLVNMSCFHGLELAMNAGLELSIGDFVYEFDTTEPDWTVEDAMAVYNRAMQGYDIVSAAPDKKQSFSSRVFYKTFRRYSPMPYEMRTESFRIISRRAINRINGMNTAVPYRKAMYANCGLRADGLTYTPAACQPHAGEKENRAYRRRLAVDTLLLFTDVGYRLSMLMTAIMMGVTVFMAVYSLAVFLLGNPVEGWTTTILFLSFAFFGLFGILTVVVKYLQIIVDLVFKRKKYTFESVEKLN